jgi:hypothetical protein
MDGLLKKSILILEDEPLIAMDHDVHAGRAGFQNVTMLSSCVAAIDWLRSNTPSRIDGVTSRSPMLLLKLVLGPWLTQ